MITLVGYVRSWGLRTEQGPIPQWGKKSHNSPFCLWFLWALEFHWCLAHLGCPGGAARGEHSGPELMCSGRGVPARWSLHHTRVNWPILVTTVHRAEHILYRYGHCKKFQAHTSAQSLPQTRRARESYKAVPDSPPQGIWPNPWDLGLPLRNNCYLRAWVARKPSFSLQKESKSQKLIKHRSFWTGQSIPTGIHRTQPPNCYPLGPFEHLI